MKEGHCFSYRESLIGALRQMSGWSGRKIWRYLGRNVPGREKKFKCAEAEECLRNKKSRDTGAEEARRRGEPGSICLQTCL